MFLNRITYFLRRYSFLVNKKQLTIIIKKMSREKHG